MILLKQRIAKLISDLGELRYPEEQQITEYKMVKTKERFCDIENLDISEWDSHTFEELWGGHREYFWFETKVTIPPRFQGKAVEYKLVTGREGKWDAVNPQFSLYVDGKLRQGMDMNHTSAVISEDAVGGKTVRIVLSAFTGDKNFHLQLNSYLRIVDRKTEQYYYDLKVPFEAAMLLPESSDEYIEIIQALNESLNRLDLRQEHSAKYDASLEEAQAYLTKEFYEKRKNDKRPKVFCVGHTHIDVAWQWTLAVTRDKAVRSFSTVLELMRRFPEYKFMSSQPQLYQYVKEDAPEIYAQIKERIREGRWEAEGGMWVEADCNISSGESLVRQFLYGKRFFREEFGAANEILWLPDVFGYSAALPQIMKKCGIRYFMTTKISWNEFDKMPYDTFLWKGIDGTEILTHFSPSRDYNQNPKGSTGLGEHENDYFTTYNAYLSPSQVKGAWQRYQQKHINKEVLMSFGYGDGGGGTTPEEVENQRRTAKDIPGLPQTKMSTAGEFFHELEQHVKDDRYLPKWVGELYLEYHRGTYTSMARNKKYNRKSEFCYKNAELFSVMNQEIAGGNYPIELINRGWECILLNQFHDILPGSSIKEVYEESKEQYDKILEAGGDIIDKVLADMGRHIMAPKGAVIVFNPNSHNVTDMVNTQQGKKLARDVPANGYKVFKLKDMGGNDIQLRADNNEMENQYFHVKFNAKGQFTSIYDKKAQRELLAKGKCGNVMMSYEDRPHNFDAWDINNYYNEKSWEVEEEAAVELIEVTDCCARVRTFRHYLNSEITQTIVLYSDIPRIDMEYHIDWKEHQVLLKTLFPLDIHTSEAFFEIQYGHVKRATHQNTSWDFAQFEVCMHKWMDISENGYGVSFLNDCKYGASVQENVVGLTMLKSGIFPNPTADQEIHEFTYSIFPHKGDFREAGTIAQAYQLNNKLFAVEKDEEGGSLPDKMSLLSADQPNVVIEVVKKAEDSDGIIVRLYETFGRRTLCRLTLHQAVSDIMECSLLEENLRRMEHNGQYLDFEIGPFEIRTFRIRFGEAYESAD